MLDPSSVDLQIFEKVEILEESLYEYQDIHENTCHQMCMDNCAYEFLDKPHVQRKHVKFLYLKVLEGNIDLQDDFQAPVLFQGDYGFYLWEE